MMFLEVCNHSDHTGAITRECQLEIRRVYFKLVHVGDGRKEGSSHNGEREQGVERGGEKGAVLGAAASMISYPNGFQNC